MTGDAPANAVGTSGAADVDVQNQQSQGSTPTKGPKISREPWYAFLDGPRDPSGTRVGFSSARAAALWIVATFTITLAVLVGIALGIAALRTNIAAVGVLVPLVVGVGPIAAASAVACFHSARDLLELRGRLLGARGKHRH